MGVPKFLERPLFGQGTGLAAETLGYTNLAGVLTIDSYWLSALLEFGVIGAGALLGMILWTIVSGAKAYVAPNDGVNRLGGPIAVSLLTFLVVKSVLSQADNHLLPFVMMAMMMVAAHPEQAFDDARLDQAKLPLTPPSPAMHVRKTRRGARPMPKPSGLDHRPMRRIPSAIGARSSQAGDKSRT